MLCDQREIDSYVNLGFRGSLGCWEYFCRVLNGVKPEFPETGDIKRESERLRSKRAWYLLIKPSCRGQERDGNERISMGRLTGGLLALFEERVARGDSFAGIFKYKFG